MHRLICLMMIGCCLGCASQEIYDPLRGASHQTVLLNGNALERLKVGMGIDEAHQILGQEIIVGYINTAHEGDLRPKLAGDQNQVENYKPLTILNPYKSEEIKLADSVYVVEYYVTMVHQPDGVITDDELTPLVFKEGKLAGRGWDFLQQLRPKT